MKAKNPLYVVHEKNGVVEEAAGVVDALIKKYNLQPALDLLDTFYVMLLNQVQTYAAFQAMKRWLDILVTQLEAVQELLPIDEITEKVSGVFNFIKKNI